MSEEQIAAFIAKNKNMIYVPTSAKEASSVQKAFEAIARQSIANHTDVIFIPVDVPNKNKLNAKTKTTKA